MGFTTFPLSDTFRRYTRLLPGLPSAMIVARIYIVRHGETEENKTGVMQGQLDTKLNAAGVEQARLAANALDQVDFVAAYSSDLSRAIQTAEIILEKHPSIVLQKHEALRERYMGDMQGHNISEWIGGMPANMERSTDFAARATGWWKDTLLRYVASVTTKAKSKARKEGELDLLVEPACILVTSHGGLIGTLLQTLIESRKLSCSKGVRLGKFQVLNASVTVVELEENGKGKMAMFADTTHLDVELVQGNADIVSG